MRTNRIAMAVFAWGLGLLCVTANSVFARPNILLITADDMNWDSVGVYGCPVADTTPNLDRLATAAFRFDTAYVPISLCTPSRQVMLSGNHSHETMTRCFTELERVGPALPDLTVSNIGLSGQDGLMIPVDYAGVDRAAAFRWLPIDPIGSATAGMTVTLTARGTINTVAEAVGTSSLL